MLECKLEVRDVGLHVFHVENLLAEKGSEEKELLRDGKNQQAESGDVCFEGIASDQQD